LIDYLFAISAALFAPPMLRRALLSFCLFLPLLSARAGNGLPVSRPGVLHLDLEAAIRMALAKNFTIKVEEFEPKISHEQVTAARGDFDPELTAEASRAYESLHGVFINGERARQTTITRTDIPLKLGLSGMTSLGTEYQLGWGSINTPNTVNNFPDILTGPTVGVTQPLLRGAGPSATLFNVRIARNKEQVSEWQLRQQLIDTITDTVYAYNELHFSIEDLKVAESSRELARQLFQDNSRRAAIGTMSPLDITTARAEVAAREEGVILAQRTVLDNENLLKQLVTNDLEPMLSVRVEIESPPRSQVPVEVGPGIRDALEFRPDYRQAKLDLEQRHITVAFQRNQALPKVDLHASLGFLGLDSDYFNSVSRIGSGDSVSYDAGIVFSFPLGNRTAKGNLNAARLEAAKSIVNLQKLEQQIVVDVDDAAGQVVTDRARIVANTEATRLARESLDAGEQRLRAGTGTTFEVLQLQKALIDAESEELRSIADHNKAVAEFFRKTGTALQKHYVDLR
jgi:outer membrane protein TolC